MNDPARSNRVLVCLVARLNSSRLPQKALADIHGERLIVRLISRLKRAKHLGKGDIVLCTSDLPGDVPLLDVAAEVGIESYAGEPEDVVDRLLAVADLKEPHSIARVTGDNVFVDPESLDVMIERHLATDSDYTRTTGMPWGCTAELFSTRCLRQMPDLVPDPSARGYLTLWAFDPDRFRCEVLDPPAEVKRPNYSLTIDTPEELELARRIFSRFPDELGGPPLADIVKFLDEDPQYTGVPDDMIIKLPRGKKTTYQWLLKDLGERAQKARRMNREAEGL